jgi:predicted nucleotidyltransferase
MDFDEFRRMVEPVFRRYDVVKAGLFGSMARGESTEDSDVDILVEFKGDKSLLDLAGLKLDIEEVLGRRVDVLTYGSIHPLLRDRILSEQKVLI